MATGTLKALFVPGGVLLLLATVALRSGLLPLSAAAAAWLLFPALLLALLLALRFRSSRVAMLLVTLLAANRTMVYFAAHPAAAGSASRTAFELLALLLPLNFLLVAWTCERGFVFPQVSAGAGLLFAEFIVFTLTIPLAARPGPVILHSGFIDPRLLSWTKIPQPALFLFTAVLAFLLVRWKYFRRPTEIGLFWALAAAGLAEHAGLAGPLATAFLATAAVILAGAIVETSYFMAFHDELTALPGRRAFNQALQGMRDSYAVAAIDIDHFKSFNDTYGHETGDHVLRMVAAKLAAVTGGGKAFRVGGEEFSILFAGNSAAEAASHLEALRTEIASSKFRLRFGNDRRSITRGAERRRPGPTRRGASPRRTMGELASECVSVTVSIGVAEPGSRWSDAEQVVRAADQALYRAKRKGRNRVEIASPSGSRAVRKSRRSIA